MCGNPPGLQHVAQKIFGRRNAIQPLGCQDLGERILGAKTGNILSKDFYCCEDESGFTSGTGSVGGKELHSLHKHQKSSGHKLIFIGFKSCQFSTVNRAVMKSRQYGTPIF
jgi:hypothetical protein